MAIPSLVPAAMVSSGLLGALVVAPPGLLVAAYSVLGALLLIIAAWAVVGSIRRARAATTRPAPHLRLLLTANAWGYSERATLDESAVGL